jgi:dolichol-phosphate mannosyltransferase
MDGDVLKRGERRVAKRIAAIHILTPLTIIVPTYKERDNLPVLVGRISALKDEFDLDLELLIMDDDSRDGSDEWVRDEGPDWARIIVRRSNRGLSPAVLDGLRAARHPVAIVMDADLSHPPEAIPSMLLGLESGQQFVIGSRYVPGGTTDDDWGILRWLNSRVATFLARPLTSAKDPMAGFFAVRTAELEKARELNPIGYKIALELIVKCELDNVGEVPIHFSDRHLGESKLTLSEQLKYLVHLQRLYAFKYAHSTSFVQFGLIGVSGIFVNLGVLTLLLWAGVSEYLALAGGIAVSVVTNFLLNRRYTFSYARDGDILKQFLGFVAASGLGGAIQFGVASAVLAAIQGFIPQLAALIGIGAGFIFNFTASRFFVFKKRQSAHAEPDG